MLSPGSDQQILDGLGARFSAVRVARALPPGFRPNFLRSVAGITTCPLAHVVTTGVD
jgi:hypothetical protein